MTVQQPPPVSRIEIADCIEFAFASSPISSDELIAAASQGSARQAVLDVLANLPDRQYHRLVDLWTHLSDLPISVDP
jgi:hypothetical protein